MLFVELYCVNVVCWIISRSGISWDRGDGFQTLKYRVSRLSERFRPEREKKNFKIVYDLCRISHLLPQHPSLSLSLNLCIFFTYVNFRKVMWLDFQTRRGGPSGMKKPRNRTSKSLDNITLSNLTHTHQLCTLRERERERQRERENVLCYIQFDEIWHRNLDQFDKKDRHFEKEHNNVNVVMNEICSYSRGEQDASISLYI